MYKTNKGQDEFSARFGQTPKGELAIKKLIQKLFRAFKKTPTDDMVWDWVEELKKIPEPILIDAYDSVLRSGEKFMPGLPEFISICKKVAPPAKRKFDDKKITHCWSRAKFLEVFGPSDPRRMAEKKSQLNPEDYESQKL